MTTLEAEAGAQAASGAAPAGLERSMKVLGTLLITLSAVTPASSVFIIVPGILQTAGSGAFLSMAAAALVGVCMAFVYAELGSAFPVAGGEYAMVGRVLGPLAGFVVLGVNLVSCVLIPAVIALGISTYLTALDPDLPAIPSAMATIALTTIIGILNIRTNAVVTGLFLLVEMLALAVLTVLGFAETHRTLGDLVLHPVTLDQGALVPASLATIGLATSVAIFAYNGYGAAVIFSEEMHEPERHLARTILWALVITVATELVPLTAVLLGAPDLPGLLGSENMFGAFIRERGGAVLDMVVSLGIALAIFNAIIAIILSGSRQIFSTGRDRVWPAAISRALAMTHPRFHSPWVATLVCGALAALSCLISEEVLLVLTGTGIIVFYGALCLAALVGRWRGATAHGRYRMPLFPLAPLAALAMMLYVIWMNWLDPVIGRPSLLATLAVMALAAGWYAFMLRRRGAWVLQGPDAR